MIKVQVKDNLIIMKGHAGYEEYGKDIVCASFSSIVITSVNACLKIEDNSVIYTEEKDKLTIEIKSNNEVILKIINNMLDMLKELALTYKKNIKIEEERS